MTDTSKTPNCDMREALVSYLYNEATPEETSRVQEHLAACSPCRQEVAEFERVRGMLQQWQLDDMPIVRLVTEAQSPRRSALAVLKELFIVTPVWAKALGVAAMAMLVLAVIGTNISVGRNGFSFRADILRRPSAAQPESLAASSSRDDSIKAADLERVRADVKILVSEMIAESERQQRDALKAQLVSLEAQLQNIHSANLAKIATRIQEHQVRLKTIERDIDRHEGSDLTDILFSEMTGKPGLRSTIVAGGGSD
ncbi:MAG TPA: zf-HC2 domain-containing protein [Blastocatellia bacterium]